MIHYQIPILFCLETHFWTNVTCFNSRKALPVFISYFYNERMNSKFFTFHNKLGKNQCIVWNQAKLSRPVLCSCNTWSVKFYFTCLFDKSGCGLKRLYIWSMSKLSLSITSNFLIHPSCLNILFLLILCTHNFDTFDKHTQMYRSRSLLNWKIKRINYIGLFIEIFSI